MGNAYDFAERELALIKKDEDGIQDMMNANVLELLKVFDEQGHSGFSASYVLGAFERLARFLPLTPLTGEEGEWNEWYKTSRGNMRQNRRCSHVFQYEDGTAKDIEGVIVSDNGGLSWYTTKDFWKQVTFPYAVPKHADKIYVEKLGEDGEYEIITDKPDRIKALYDRKRKEFDKAYGD